MPERNKDGSFLREYLCLGLIVNPEWNSEKVVLGMSWFSCESPITLEEILV